MSAPQQDEDIRSIEFQVGATEHPDGLTRIEINRSGSFVVTHEQSGDEEVRERTEGEVGEFAGIEAEKIFAQIATIEPSDDFPTRQGVPDEPIVVIRFETATGARTTRMWLRDVEDDRKLGPALNSMRTIVERSTDGKRYL